MAWNIEAIRRRDLDQAARARVLSDSRIQRRHAVTNPIARFCGSTTVMKMANTAYDAVAVCHRVHVENIRTCVSRC